MISSNTYKTNPTVLIADDEKSVLTLMSRVLRKNNWTVLEANSGVEAVSAFESSEKRIHLVILDVVMPGMDGYATAQSIRNCQPDIKILYVSGFNLQTVSDRGIEIYNAPLLKKPFTVEQLTQEAEAAIA